MQKISPIEPAEGKWKKFEDPRPYVAVNGLAVGPFGNFPIFYRTDKVRSAKNAWSMPSGLHEVGYNLLQQFAIELYEEIGIIADHTKGEIIGSYENIAAVDSWHWVVNFVVVPVKTFDGMVNKEPEKHANLRTVFLYQVLNNKPWTPGLEEFLVKNYDLLQFKIEKMVQGHKL